MGKNRKLSICLVTRYFDFRNAGIGRVSSEIANRLEERGHEVCRISTDTWNLYQYFRYTTFELPFKIPRGYDIYHALTPLESLYIPKKKGIVTYYDFIPFLYPDRAGTGLNSSWILKYGSRVYFKLLCKIATHCKELTAISEATKNDLHRAFGVDESRITVVRLGIRPDLEPQPKPDNIFRIGYLGQLDRRKRVHLLVEAFRKSDIKGELVIGGIGPEEWSLKALSQGDNRIKFLGLVPDDELVAFYNSLDVFCFPSMIEGLGLPPIEAFACKKPVIVLNDAIIPSEVKYRCIVVADLDSFFANPKIWQMTPSGIIEENYAFAKSHNWERCVDQYEELYQRILNRRE